MTGDEIMIGLGLVLFVICGPLFYMEADWRLIHPEQPHGASYWIALLLCLGYLAWSIYYINH